MALNWLWRDTQTEHRAEPTNYTDRTISEILARATGTAADPTAIAATEAAVGTYGRCIASATLTPQNPLTASVTPEVLALAGRGLATKGNALFVIQVEGGTVRLAPVAYWNVEGESDPASWRYRCDLAGPSRQRTRVVDASGVVHFRINCDVARPWRGRGPLEVASASGKLLGAVEQSLQREQLFRPTRIVYSPRGTEQITDLIQDVSKGGLIAESVNEADPAASIKTPASVGPEPDAAQIDLRTDVSRSILSCYGLSPALFEAAGDGSGQREAWRRAWSSCFLPIVRCMSFEIASKLDTPGADLELSELRASDAQGQGRALSARAVAVKQLVEAGVERVTGACELAGFQRCTNSGKAPTEITIERSQLNAEFHRPSIVQCNRGVNRSFTTTPRRRRILC